jgi:putative PEP-CTERM system TPR-repeat lipoprotein
MDHIFKLHYLFKLFLLAGFLLTVSSCDNTGMDEQQMLENAKNYLNNGKLMAASIELRNTLQMNNENAEARYLLGSISLQAGDLASAEKELRRAADAGWSQDAVQLQLARIFIFKKAFKELLDEIRPADTWSVDTRANIAGLRALAEASLNDFKKAKITLDNGKALNKDAVQILRTTAILQIASVLEGDASDTLETAKSLYPDNPEILLLYASFAIQKNNLTRAADTYSSVIALEPPNFLTANGRRARIGLARLQIIEKSYDDASTTLEPLLTNNSKDPEANYLASLLAFSQRDLARAEDHVRKLLAVTPDNIPGQQLLGKIKYAQKDYDQAAHHLSNYLNAFPDDKDVRKLLANSYIILNQPEQARTTLQYVLKSNPHDAGALILLSQIEFDSGNIDAGIAALRKAAISKPKNAQLHKYLAKAYIRNGQTALAQSEIALYQKLSGDTEKAQKLTISNYLQAGQTDKALDTANLILANNPENPDTLALIGSLYADSGDDQQARSHFSKAIKIHGGHPAATLGLAGIERKSENLNKAISLYERLVNSNTAGTLPMLELAEIAAQQKRINDMISWLEKARAAAPSETRASLILAKYYLKINQPQKAEIYTKEAITRSPEQTDIIALHAKVLIAQKRYNEALPMLKKLMAKFPESLAAQSLLGEIYLRQNMLEDARKHLHKALMLKKDNIIVNSLLAETELKDGNPDGSLEYAKSIQTLQPDLYIGHMLEGDTWMAKQKYNRARFAYDKAWKRQQTAQLANRLFQASKNITSLDSAIRPLLIWLKNNPEDNSTRLNLATIYQSAKEHDKAISEYEILLKQTPDNSTVLNNLAWLYSLKDNPKAMNMAESAYRFSPENPAIQDTYGWILVQQGQVEKGQRLIKQALEAIPGNQDIRYHYAVALLKSGNSTEGKQILEKLLEQDKPFEGRNEAKRLFKDL